MTFWQENYGFVKEVYDFRCQKYLEWMDNIEAIIGKVMANTQYTAKEFKIIKDTFTSLCRDLEKENTKQWLDMMLEKLSAHSNEDEGNVSGRDKALKLQEKKKLEAMIERHKTLMEPTKEAQSKVEHYSECYAFGDDIHPIIKVLNEQKHLSMKEIHPHNMDMCEEQIDKQEKVLSTIEKQHHTYTDLMKRGLKLKSNPSAPEFLAKEIARLEEMWKTTNEKARERIDLLNATYKDWDVYDNQRQAINTPLDAMDEQFKTYKKLYDAKKGADWLERKKKKAGELTKQINEIYDTVTRAFKTIIALAGEDKRDFMEKEINDINDRKVIVEKVDKTLEQLTDFNNRLTKMVTDMAELRAWMMPAMDKLNFITTSTELTPEDRVKEIFDMQAGINERLPLLQPLEDTAHDLLDVPGEESEEGQTNETAIAHMTEFMAVKDTITELHEKVEVEAGSITQDQRYFADYLYGVKNFKPWMDEAEAIAKAPLEKPTGLEEAKKLLETVLTYQAGTMENKTNLDAAAESRSKMEKHTKAESEVEGLTQRWNDVRKTADDRVAKIQELVETWSQLQDTMTGLTTAITTIPDSQTPDLSILEGKFMEFREINEKKVNLLNVV